MQTLEETIAAIVKQAIEEDSAHDDLTSKLTIPEGMKGSAGIIAREEGVISGQDAASAAFREVDRTTVYDAVIPDGGRAGENDVVARIKGDYASILSAERTALNLLGHLSGVATLTARYVRMTSDSGVQILDTRKTTPGMRLLEKRAVADGGGMNHRLDLASYILVKENHIQAAGGLSKLSGVLGTRILEAEIEVTSPDQLRVLRSTPPARIMLDNFSPGMIREALAEMDSWKAGRPEIEVSGGIDLTNISSFLIKGIDYISVGALTSSAPSLDLTLLSEGAA
ncbi:MAG: carboxylating nicotinate-nucleotide diphosphorylase [Candidatus Krumholzibacteriota bacterium]|nr:carboxylating nicotinate-nucleotide diphosphorylase [Candidatus Krumholzibacteriota bacterium]